MREGERPRQLFFVAFAVVVALTLARIAVLIASPLELYPDEAQYWWWARFPALGYFSKPPLIAWIVRVTTFFFGDREWAIRLSMPLLHGGTSLILFAIARTAFPRMPAAAFWSALAYLTVPGVSYSCGIASTDAPLLFFWTLSLFTFLRAMQTPGWHWPLLCGASTGLGILAKYTMLFFIVSAVMAAASNSQVRKFVFSGRGLLAAAIAVLVVAPNVAWNASHGFATVGQVEANADWGRAVFNPLHLFAFLGGQFGVFGPVLMAAWLSGILRTIRGDATAVEIALCAMSGPILVLIAIQSFIQDANANWAATAYVAAIPIAIAEILRHWPRQTLAFSFALHGSILVLLWIVLVSPPMADRLGVGNAFKREEGWRMLADGVRAQFAQGGYGVVASDNRSVTAELLYYLRPKSPPIRIWDPDAASHNHFEMTMRLLPPAPHVLLVLAPQDAPQVASTFESVRLMATVAVPVGGRHIRVMRLYDARDYRGPRIRG